MKIKSITIELEENSEVYNTIKIDGLINNYTSSFEILNKRLEECGNPYRYLPYIEVFNDYEINLKIKCNGYIATYK